MNKHEAIKRNGNREYVRIFETDVTTCTVSLFLSLSLFHNDSIIRIKLCISSRIKSPLSAAPFLFVLGRLLETLTFDVSSYINPDYFCISRELRF